MLRFVNGIGCSVILIAGNERFCWSKNAKTASVLLTCCDTTTSLQNLVRYHVFPAKMTLVCARSLLFYEKISYS